jgi:NADPH:quinone reductase-like Zn-dependent oxidoreductase
MRFHDIIDSTFAFEKGDEAIEHVWQSKQVGKVIIRV